MYDSIVKLHTQLAMRLIHFAKSWLEEHKTSSMMLSSFKSCLPCLYFALNKAIGIVFHIFPF